MEPLRLGVVCHPTYGGSGVVATELANALARRGHEVHVVSWEEPFRFDRELENLHFHKVDVSDYPLFRHRPYSLNLTNALIRLVEKEGVQVIHSHYAIPHAHTAWMAREVLREERGLDVKLACTLHGTDITLVGVDPWFFELTRFAIRRQDLLTAPSAWLAGKTEAEFHTGEPIRVIPNFVDLARFRPGDGQAVRERLGVGDRRLITHASNFRPVKRVPDVINGFAVLRAQIPSVLVLAGDGPELQPALAQARQLGVLEDVRPIGRVDGIEEILQASDLYLLPSVAESFGLSALEAQACGCPVLGYQAGGLPEVVKNGVSGILCPAGEDVCLGGLAADLFADPERYSAMRLAARENAQDFDLGPIVDQYEAELRSLIGRPRHAPVAVASR